MPLETEYTQDSYGNSDLVLERKRMMNEWERGSRQIRSGLSNVEEAVLIGAAGYNLDKATRLTQVQINVLYADAKVEMVKAISDAQDIIEKRIEVAVRRGVRSYNKIFREAGLSKLNDSEIQKLRLQILSDMRKEFPPRSGFTTVSRISRATNLHLKQLKDTLGRSYKQGMLLKELKKRMYRGLRKTGQSGIVGGSLGNKLKQIMAAEEARATNLVAVGAMKARNIEFAYWRLSPNHPWYGGGEICELHSIAPYSGPIEELKSAGLQGAGLEGLYLLANYPNYPHPWCLCYPEPLIGPA